MWFAALEVALGLGFVIFVHELGHFAVAKMCGVKVDKFFIGFDIGGLKLCSFRWGETLYGIGILPLGGYVKMLGQEDNPAQLRKEMERARQEAANGSAPAATELASGAETGGEPPEDGVASAEKRFYDPRSYLAKSVPQRMAIISAGVIMNMIFALVFAVVAFLVGVKQTPTVVGGVTAGGAAWQAGLRSDDKILEVAGCKVHQWRQMNDEIRNADLAQGIPLLIQRPGIADPLVIDVKPEQLFGMPMIGVANSWELKLVSEKNSLPFLPDSAAEKAKGPLMPGDRIVQIDGQPMGSYGQLQDFLVAHAGDDLAVTVAREKAPAEKGAKPEETEKIQVTVPKGHMRQFGLIMEMGPIAAVQTNSPAAKADIRPGDLLKSIDGKPVADPMRLPDELHKRACAEGHSRAGARRKNDREESQSVFSDTLHAFRDAGQPRCHLGTGGRLLCPEYGCPRRTGESRRRSRSDQGRSDHHGEGYFPSCREMTEIRNKYHNSNLGAERDHAPVCRERAQLALLLDGPAGCPSGNNRRIDVASRA